MQPERHLRIVIPGGTGLLGQLLAHHFHESGHSVTVLTRQPHPAPWQMVAWNGRDLDSWTQSLEGADVLINLAGRSVNCRYTARNRREIMTSRTVSTAVLGRAVAEAARPPHLWLNASTATIYRHSVDTEMDEIHGTIGGSEPNVPDTWRFSIDVATAWERAFFAASTPKTRKVALRTAMVMSPASGGAFDHYLRLVRWGLGGPSGPGRQYVSWIHDVDFVRAIEFLIAAQQIEGVVNIASPCPETNRRFMSCLRRSWCTSYVGLRIPTWALSIGAVFLRTETELVLKSRRVVPRRLLDAGFDFHFPNWRGAASDLVQRWRVLNND